MKASGRDTPPMVERYSSGASTASPGSCVDDAERSEERLQGMRGCASATGSIVDMAEMSEYKVEQELLKACVSDMDCRIGDALRRMEEVSEVAGSARGISNENKERMRVLERRMDLLETFCVLADGGSPRSLGDAASRRRHLKDKLRSLSAGCFDARGAANHGPSPSTALSDQTIRDLPIDTLGARPCEFFSLCQEEGAAEGPENLEEWWEAPTKDSGASGASQPCEYYSLCQEEVGDQGGVDRSVSIFEAEAEAVEARPQRLDTSDVMQVQIDDLDAKVIARLDKQAEATESMLRRLTRVESCWQSEDINAKWRETQTNATELILQRLETVERSCSRDHEIDAIITAKLENAVRENMASFMARSRGAAALTSSREPSREAGSMDEQLRSMRTVLAETVDAHSKALESLESAIVAPGAHAATSTAGRKGSRGSSCGGADDDKVDAFRGAKEVVKSSDHHTPRQPALFRVSAGGIKPNLGHCFAFIQRQCAGTRNSRHRVPEVA